MDDGTRYKEIKPFDSIEIPLQWIFSQFSTSLMWSKENIHLFGWSVCVFRIFMLFFCTLRPSVNGNDVVRVCD